MTDGLSGYMNRLWSLQQHILMRWGVYTVFSEQCAIVPLGSRGYVRWLVPLDVPDREEIVEFVRHELDDLNTADMEGPDLDKFPGTDVEVRSGPLSRFGGIEPYVERDVVEKMVKGVLARLMEKFARKDTTPEEGAAPPGSNRT